MKKVYNSPLVNVLLFSLFWAVEIFNSKLAFLADAQLVRFSLQSAFLTLIILSIYIFSTKRKQLKKISTNTFKWLIIANAIHMGLGGFLSYAGVQLTTAINAGFLTQLTLVTGTIFAWIILKEKMTATKIISMIVIISGAFLLTTKGHLIIPQIGDVLLLLACICWGLGGVIIRKILKNKPVDPDIVSLFRPAAGIPVIIIFMLLSPLYPASIQKVFQVNIFELHLPLYVIINAILLSLTWIFVNRTLKIASVSYTAMMSSVTPILVALLATIFLNEQIQEMQFVGILLIIASSFITHTVDKQV